MSVFAYERVHPILISKIYGCHFFEIRNFSLKSNFSSVHPRSVPLLKLELPTPDDTFFHNSLIKLYH